MSIVSNGDNLTGDGSGDDETSDIYLNDIEDNIAGFYVILQMYDTGT